MKTALVVSGIFLCFSVFMFLYFMPLSNYLARYLWWRLSADVSVLSGDVFSEGTRIHYTVYGQGSPVLLLHGGLSNKLSWFSQLPELADCGYRLILLDSRGHGLSGLGDSDLSYRLLADDALAVLDRLKIARVDVLGWSDGANTALQLASQSPQRIGKIVAISGNYSPQGLTDKARQDNLEQSTGMKYWLYTLWTGAEGAFQELEKRLKKLWGSGPLLSDNALAEIKSPVLIIVGDKDVVTVEHARDMAELLPKSTLHIVHNGGHSTLMVNASEVNQLIRGFFNQARD